MFFSGNKELTEEQKESIDLIESESEALEKEEQSQVIDASQNQSSDTKEE